MTGHQRCDQRHQGIEIGGQIDVHVSHHIGVRRQPHCFECPAPPFLVQMVNLDSVDLVGESTCDSECSVGTGIVSDRDRGPERDSVLQMLVKTTNALFEIGLFVVYRNDHLESGRGVRAGPLACCSCEGIRCHDDNDRARTLNRPAINLAITWETCRSGACGVTIVQER